MPLSDETKRKVWKAIAHALDEGQAPEEIANKTGWSLSLIEHLIKIRKEGYNPYDPDAPLPSAPY